jgi:hypothetical protein
MAGKRSPGAAGCTASEANATVQLRLEVVKGKKVPWMRIDKLGSIVAVSAARPLEAAVEAATVHLIDWLVTEHGFSARSGLQMRKLPTAAWRSPKNSSPTAARSGASVA